MYTKFYICLITYFVFQNCPPETRYPADPCLKVEFQCRDQLTCIEKAWVCDGEADCADESDESPDICKKITCRPDQFLCNNRECIPGHLHCDGKSDCLDSSDEQNCGQ